MPATTSTLPRGSNWDPQEDKHLAKAWVIVSTDAEVGADKTADIFWKKVASHYNSFRSGTHKKFERGPKSVMKLNESGKSAEDHIDDAEVMYKKLYEQRLRFWGVGERSMISQSGKSYTIARTCVPTTVSAASPVVVAVVTNRIVVPWLSVLQVTWLTLQPGNVRVQQGQRKQKTNGPWRQAAIKSLMPLLR
ncbi:hypothetical protein JG687_00018468 [Phytophthora cactorum]|uniref:Uncharacterized protein n=1 Tax=Phytophthora cactorum TaxID=29920 RepID=A0A8T1TNV2_9STRA|nr:hypothetical protein PC120_g7673 [Phytophthora cactorum]KAG4055452.1 hypothetical protein PC123_g9438 [Phytophthora cactorum]KAG6943436.1 hypothetical protein JG687_00018468 [Phytophthora cactorum]